MAQLKSMNVPRDLVAMLETANNSSNELVAMEKQAFEAVANNDVDLLRQLVYSSAYEEQLATIEGMTASTQSLTSLFMQLNEKIAKFKL